jgi:hypothetical protein
MAGNKALGECFRRYREPKPQRAVAGAIGKSTRWLAYVEAGRAMPDCDDLVAVASMLGGGQGPAFLHEALTLLYEEVEMDRVKSQIRDNLHRRAFLGGLGAVTLVDLERLESGPEKRIETRTLEEMKAFTQFCVNQSRALAPGVVLSALEAHMRGFVDLIGAAPGHTTSDLQAAAAEAALLTAVLSYRMDLTAEATQNLLLASGLAAESGHITVQANVLAMQGLMHSVPAQGWARGDAQRARALYDQALTIIGPEPAGVAGATFYAWRAVQQATLGEATAAARDLEAAQHALAREGSVDDLTGLGVRNELDLAVEHAVSAIQLRQPKQVLTALDMKAVGRHPSAGWRAARIAELAAAHAQSGEVDESVRLLLEAVDVLSPARDAWRSRRLQGVRNVWLPKGISGESVEALDQRLAALAG